MNTKKKAKSPTRTLTVPREQWDLPVAVHSDGTLVSLKDFTRTKAPALSFSQLSQDQQSELVAARIDQQAKFEVAMIGAGIVDKQRAIQEVRARTPVGRTLIEIEQRMINRMLNRAKQGE